MPSDKDVRERLREFFRGSASGATPHLGHGLAQEPETPERTTSAAKSFEPDALSNAGSTREPFDRAAEGGCSPERGSPAAKPSLRHAPARPLEPRPDGRRWWERPTREAFRRKQAREWARAKDERARGRKEDRSDDDDGRKR